MEYKHFGALLKELREKYNMSREELAEGICTSKQIYRIENGFSEPSIYILNQLSLKFNLDLNEYYKMHFFTQSISALEGITSINDAIDSSDFHKLRSIIEHYENHKDFKNGETLQHIYYGKALCSALLDEDYNTSLEYSYKGIKVEFPDFSIDKVSENMYSNIGIVILNCISQNYFALNNYTDGMKVLSGLLTILETYAINSPLPLLHSLQFSKKIYQAVLYNMSVRLYEHGEIEKARFCIDKAIEFSLKEHILRYFSRLLLMKCMICYSDKNYSQAQEYYDQAVDLAKLTNDKSALEDMASLSKDDYPEIDFSEIII